MAQSDPSTDMILYGLWTRYSSWTVRVVLVLDFFEIPYNPRYYNIYDPASRPSDENLQGRLVPMLQPNTKDPGFIIEDSLAICEYLADSFPDRNLWPRDAQLRALARSAAAQMHAGFSEDALQWMRTMWSHPVMVAQARGYFDQAKDEATRVDRFDDIF